MLDEIWLCTLDKLIRRFSCTNIFSIFFIADSLFTASFKSTYLLLSLLQKKQNHGPTWGKTPLSLMRHQNVTNEVTIYSLVNGGPSRLKEQWILWTRRVMEEALCDCVVIHFKRKGHYLINIYCILIFFVIHYFIYTLTLLYQQWSYEKFQYKRNRRWNSKTWTSYLEQTLKNSRVLMLGSKKAKIVQHVLVAPLKKILKHWFSKLCMF